MNGCNVSANQPEPFGQAETARVEAERIEADRKLVEANRKRRALGLPLGEAERLEAEYHAAARAEAAAASVGHVAGRRRVP